MTSIKLLVIYCFIPLVFFYSGRAESSFASEPPEMSVNNLPKS